MMMLPQVEEEQQQQEQPVWPFPTTCSKLSQGRIPYPPLFLLLLSFFFSILFGNSEEIVFLQLQFCSTTLLQTFLKKSDKTQLPKCNSHTTHTHSLSLSLESKFLQQKMYVSETKTEKICLYNNPPQKKKPENGFRSFISS